MEIWTAIKEAPEWVALLVALSGLAFQQRQIRQLQREQKSERDAEISFLRERMDRMTGRVDKLTEEILKRTDHGAV